jgi:hypothetical protein
MYFSCVQFVIISYFLCLVLFDFIAKYLVKSKIYVSLYSEILFSVLFLPSLRSKYFPQQPVLKHP